MKAWHFVGDTLRDGRPVPADGVELVHEGAVEMCRSGLHASTRLLDALSYSRHITRALTACRVECRNIVDRHRDKLVCRSRTILYRVAAKDILRIFARRCALDVAHLWDAPDVALRYLRTGDESLRDAARAAGRDAARDAPWDAARDAALAAARDAARAAARDAARDAALAAARNAALAAAWDAALAAARNAALAAAWDAARAAARNAALAAAWDAARAAARDAARDAAWDAARAAAWEKQNRRLVQLVVAERRKA